MRNVSNEELGTLRADYRNFIRHFKHTVYEVEKAKIAICSTIANWQLDATYQVPPAYQVKIPREPFREDPLWATVRLDVYRLRDVFERKIWNNKLKPAICDALTRATSELNGKPISIILLSGGSSNIRWLAQLLKRDLKSRLPEAEILELQENFQEIVAKGLAVECARRTYNDGKGDFRSMTYNRLYLALAADEGDVKICRFKSLTEGLPSGNEDGVLLPAASVLSGFIEKPIKWRVSLQHPPRRALDYYFMRTSFDYKDTHNVHNVDHRVYTPKGATFSKPSFQVELTVKDDGTTTLKFIYREARPSIPPIEVRGQPFYLDMTFGSESAVGQAYLGFDFGTSNSAFSFVEQAAIRVYSERGRDSNWRELSDLVSLLPYPVASPLAKYIAETNTSQREWLGLETFEALLCLAAYTSYAEYCCMKGCANAKLFKSLSDNKRSAGPLWVLLRESLKQLRGHAFFSKHYFKLIEEPLISDIDQAVTQVAQFKHGKESAGVDYVRILSMLGNITYKVFADQCFGAFESVTKQRLRKEFSGYFRCARGASPPFIELHEYSGKESFSEEQIFVCNPASGKALLLTPLMLWLPIETNKWTPELQLLMFDNGKKGRLFEFKATEKRPGLTVNASVELEPIF